MYPSKIGTMRIVLLSQGVVVNGPQDAAMLVAEGGPIIPARLFEGSYTTFVTQQGLPGNNGVVFHDARPATAAELGLEELDWRLQARVAVEGGYSVMNSTRFNDVIVYGLFTVDIDIYDPARVHHLQQFFAAMESGFVRIGGKRTVHGQMDVYAGPVVSPILADDFLPPMVIQNPGYRCYGGHVQPEAIRLKGGHCPTCGCEVEPQWFRDAVARRPWKGKPRVSGDNTPLLESVEEILELHLGLELPENPREVYWTIFGPEYNLWPVNRRSLALLGIPRFPWQFASMNLWKSRLDVLAGLAIIFRAQPGVSVETAVTAAAVVHRLLTGFRLTRENSGKWIDFIDQKRAEEVFQFVWNRADMYREYTGSARPLQQIAAQVVHEFGLIHTASVEYLMREVSYE